MEIRGYAVRERAVRRVLVQSGMQLTETLRAVLDQEPNVVLGLALDGSIVFLNQEWSLSARRDGDLPGLRSEFMLGRSYLDSVAGALKVRVAEALAQAAALAPGYEAVWLHGECNSLSQFRKLSTRISPLRSGGDEGEVTGLLVHHSLRLVGPLSEKYTLLEPAVDAWRGANHIIVQCGCCRRVRDPASRRWVMCLELLKAPADDTSHGLCEVCLENYYP